MEEATETPTPKKGREGKGEKGAESKREENAGKWPWQLRRAARRSGGRERTRRPRGRAPLPRGPRAKHPPPPLLPPPLPPPPLLLLRPRPVAPLLAAALAARWPLARRSLLRPLGSLRRGESTGLSTRKNRTKRRRREKETKKRSGRKRRWKKRSGRGGRRRRRRRLGCGCCRRCCCCCCCSAALPPLLLRRGIASPAPGTGERPGPGFGCRATRLDDGKKVRERGTEKKKTESAPPKGQKEKTFKKKSPPSLTACCRSSRRSSPSVCVATSQLDFVLNAFLGDGEPAPKRRRRSQSSIAFLLLSPPTL